MTRSQSPRPTAAQWSVEPTEVDHPEARAVLRAYLTELVARYHGRPAGADEVAAALAAEPAEGLAVLLLARHRGAVSGCIGLRRLGPALGEVTKVYVRPGARGLGGGARLLAEVERAARQRGMTVLRLGTRADLVEARALYARHGYREIPRYHDDPYEDHWFEKRLPPVTGGVTRPAAS
ncbi:GNAT family N-acetyltransferase [Kitasatospora sp. NPDC052896]|uniref:GNAT family N-acetyltransferase n=1 Tax=Kitasatospora sp. NPDC052896 TaxID=3364061 RepID=UPI0037CB5A5F